MSSPEHSLATLSNLKLNMMSPSRRALCARHSQQLSDADRTSPGSCTPIAATHAGGNVEVEGINEASLHVNTGAALVKGNILLGSIDVGTIKATSASFQTQGAHTAVSASNMVHEQYTSSQRHARSLWRPFWVTSLSHLAGGHVKGKRLVGDKLSIHSGGGAIAFQQIMGNRIELKSPSQAQAAGGITVDSIYGKVIAIDSGTDASPIRFRSNQCNIVLHFEHPCNISALLAVGIVSCMSCPGQVLILPLCSSGFKIAQSNGLPEQQQAICIMHGLLLILCRDSGCLPCRKEPIGNWTLGLQGRTG